MSSECSRFEIAISAYMDEEMTKEGTPALFIHLAECEQCRNFWQTALKLERVTLREERMVASGNLDERVASIGQSSRPRSIKRQFGVVGTSSQNKKSVSYSLIAFVSVLAGALGIFLGMLQPWSGGIPERTEPQIVYVSVLPNITVLGHLNGLDRQGGDR